MKNLKFNLPIWLLVLITSFSLFSCNSEDVTIDDEQSQYPIVPSNSGGMVFVIVDKEYNNLFKDKENAPYDMDYIHIITPDGKYKDNLGEQYREHYHIPYHEGFSFISPLLSQVAGSVNYEKKFWKKQYSNKPLFLVISPTDTDTLMWNSTDGKLYHNGNEVYQGAIVKDFKK